MEQLIKVLEIHSLGIDNIVQLSNKAKSYYHIAIDDIGTCIVLGAQCNESERLWIDNSCCELQFLSYFYAQNT